MDARSDGPIPRAPLSGVAYVNLPDAIWRIPERALDRLDFGVDLRFGPETYSASWAIKSDQGLEIQPRSLLVGITNAVATDVSGLAPWKRLLGLAVVHSQLYRPSKWTTQVCPGTWVLLLDFGQANKIWIASANYSVEVGTIAPCVDEVLVIADEALAREFELMD